MLIAQRRTADGPSLLVSCFLLLTCFLTPCLSNTIECYSCASKNILALRPDVADLVPSSPESECFNPQDSQVPIVPCSTACYYAIGPLVAATNNHSASSEKAVIRGCWLDLFGIELPWMFGKKDRCGGCSEMLNTDKCLIRATQDVPRSGMDEVCICWDHRCNHVSRPAKLLQAAGQQRQGDVSGKTQRTVNSATSYSCLHCHPLNSSISISSLCVFFVLLSFDLIPYLL